MFKRINLPLRGDTGGGRGQVRALPPLLGTPVECCFQTSSRRHRGSAGSFATFVELCNHFQKGSERSRRFVVLSKSTQSMVLTHSLFPLVRPLPSFQTLCVATSTRSFSLHSPHLAPTRRHLICKSQSPMRHQPNISQHLLDKCSLLGLRASQYREPALWFSYPCKVCMSRLGMQVEKIKHNSVR